MLGGDQRAAANAEKATPVKQLPPERTWEVTVFNPVTGNERTETIVATILDLGAGMLVFHKAFQNEDGDVYLSQGVRAINHWISYRETTVIDGSLIPGKSRILAPGN